MKSFQSKKREEFKTPPEDPGNPTVNFHGEKRLNETHESKKAIPKRSWRAKVQARRLS